MPDVLKDQLKEICERNDIDLERLLSSFREAKNVYRPVPVDSIPAFASQFLQHISFTYSNPLYSEFSLVDLKPVTNFLEGQLVDQKVIELSISASVSEEDRLVATLLAFKKQNQWVEELRTLEEIWLVIGNMTLRALRRPLLSWRRKRDRNRGRMRSLLENSASNGVWSTIELGSPVHNRFLFRLPYRRELRGDSFVVDLAFFVLQTGDEFLDGLVSILREKKELNLLTDKLSDDSSLLYFKWDQGKIGTEIILSKGLLEVGGKWVDTVNEKYQLSYREIYSRIELILDELNDSLSKLERKNDIGESILTFFNFCIQSGLDDILLMELASEEPVSLNAIRWQFYKKTDLVMSYWIQLRALVLDLPFTTSSNRYVWGSLLHNCQIFDDLKDVKVDYLHQANLVHSLAFHCHREEYDWFKEHLDKIPETPDMDLICKLILNMPLTVLHSYTYSRYKGVCELDWLTMKGANVGWFRNWTGMGQGFDLGPHLRSSLNVSNSPVADLIINSIMDLKRLFQSDLQLEDKLAFLFDLLYYDNGFSKALQRKMNIKERYLLRMNGFFISSSYKVRLFSRVVQQHFSSPSEINKMLEPRESHMVLNALDSLF